MSVDIILIALVLLLLSGAGGYGYSRGGWSGPVPGGGLLGVLLIALVLIYLFGRR